MLPADQILNVVEASRPPGPLPQRPELRVEHAPAVKVHGRLLLMIAAAYGARGSGPRAEDTR